MARDHKFGPSRRLMLAGSLAAMGAGLIGQVGTAQQPTKLAQNVVMYQDHPKGDQKSSICASYRNRQWH